MSDVVVQDQRNAFETYGEAVTPNVITGQLLRFSKFGDYKAGQDDEEIEMGTRLIAYLPSLRVGWIRWLDNRPIENQMGLLIDGFAPVKREELGDNDKSMWEKFEDGREKDPWQFSNQLVMYDPASKELYTFATASKGGLGAIGELSKAYGKRIRQSPDEVPVIELNMRSYEHATYGEIRTPKFDIVDWVKAPAVLANLSSDAEAEPVKALPKGKPAAKKKNGGRGVKF